MLRIQNMKNGYTESYHSSLGSFYMVSTNSTRKDYIYLKRNGTNELIHKRVTDNRLIEGIYGYQRKGQLMEFETDKYTHYCI